MKQRNKRVYRISFKAITIALSSTLLDAKLVGRFDHWILVQDVSKGEILPTMIEYDRRWQSRHFVSRG